MRVSIDQQTDAGKWRRLVDDLSGQVKERQGSPQDLNPSPDGVLIEGKDSWQPPQFPQNAPYGEFRDKLLRGEVHTGQDGQVTSAHLQTKYYYETRQYGPSAAVGMDYQFQDKGDQLEYLVHRQDPARQHSFDVRFSVDAKSGDLLSYKRKDYAMTFPQALKEVITDKNGLILVGLAAFGGGIPMGLPGALAQGLLGPGGPVVSAVASAVTTALVLAKLKTRPW